MAKRTRKFGGKTYSLAFGNQFLDVAQRRARQLRQRGYYVRLVPTSSGGIDVYSRRK